MPLFSRKRSLLADVQASKWRDDDERATMVAQLRELSVRPEVVISLLWHRDASVRSVGADKFLEGADAKSVMSLVKALDGKPRHVKAYVSYAFKTVVGVTNLFATKCIILYIIEKALEGKKCT